MTKIAIYIKILVTIFIITGFYSVSFANEPDTTDYNETKKSGEHSARIVMVNTKGFYNNLIKFINHQVKSGFMKKEHFKTAILVLLVLHVCVQRYKK